MCVLIGHISDQLHRLILQCTDERGLTAKRQRRFAKYRQQINECGDDINALSRFVGAQVVAFRKILKKYKVGQPTILVIIVSRHVTALALALANMGLVCLEMDTVYDSGQPF